MSKAIIEKMMESKDRYGRIEPQIEIIDIDADTADWLIGMNKVNRVIRHNEVNRYSRDMKTGAWEFTGDSVKQDQDGNIIDGQHRLRAVMLSGVTIRVVFITGLPPEVQQVIDGGTKRTVADALNFAGVLAADSKYASRIAAAARQAWNIDTNGNVTRREPPSTSELIEWIGKNPSIQDAVYAVDGMSKTISIPPAYSAVAYFYGMKQVPQETVKFFNDLRSMVGLRDTDPALLLRLRLSSPGNADTFLEKFWLILRAMNMARYGLVHTRLGLPSRPEGTLSDRIIQQIALLTAPMEDNK